MKNLDKTYVLNGVKYVVSKGLPNPKPNAVVTPRGMYLGEGAFLDCDFDMSEVVFAEDALAGKWY